MCVGDIVFVLFDRKIGKGDYRLARVLKVHPSSQEEQNEDVSGLQDSSSTEHHVIRTVTVGMRHRDKREPGLPYEPRPLQELKIGVQRIAVICPYEEQQRVENVSEGQDVRES